MYSDIQRPNKMTDNSPQNKFEEIWARVTPKLLAKLGIKPEEKQYLKAFMWMIYIQGWNDGSGTPQIIQ